MIARPDPRFHITSALPARTWSPNALTSADFLTAEQSWGCEIASSFSLRGRGGKGEIERALPNTPVALRRRRDSSPLESGISLRINENLKKLWRPHE
jgi:hypothetical protein